MKCFKVNKKIFGEPKIIGLSINLFFLFIAVIVGCSFTLMASVTVIKILIVIAIILASYIIFKFLDSDYLNNASNEKCPEIITINIF